MSELNVQTVQSQSLNAPVQFKDSAGTEIGTLCRAWVNFNGEGTVSIRASFNVLGLTDLGIGRYRVSFQNSMPDTNYCPVSSGASNGTFTTNPGPVQGTIGVYSLSTNSFEIASIRPGDGGEVASPTDPIYCFVSVFR